MDNVHVGDVAKCSFFDQVTLQAKVKEDSGAVKWLEPMTVRFPMWMKGHAVGRDPAAVFFGGTLYQIKGDSHSYVQTWRVQGGQLKQAKRAQWSGVAGYLPITDAAVVAEVEGAMEMWKLLLAGHQRLRARTVAIVVHLDCRPSEPWYFPFKHYATAQAPGPLALECHCDCW